MFLSGKTIRELEIVSPHHPRTVFQGATFGESLAGYDCRLGVGNKGTILRIFRGGFRLAYTIEHICVPNDCIGLVCDKSTWARRGIALQNTVLEPGWEGHVTLEISYHGSMGWYDLPRHVGICQILFARLDQETEGYKGKYQGQPAKPVEAIDEQD